MNIEKMLTAEMPDSMVGKVVTSFDTQVSNPDVNVASYGLTKQLNDNLTQYDMNNAQYLTDKFRFATKDGKDGYIKKVEGADTFFPFINLKEIVKCCYARTGSSNSFGSSVRNVDNNTEYDYFATSVSTYSYSSEYVKIETTSYFNNLTITVLKDCHIRFTSSTTSGSTETLVSEQNYTSGSKVINNEIIAGNTNRFYTLLIEEPR